MNKIPISRPHPNLIMGMDESDISVFVAKVLQSLQESEEQLKADQKQLRAGQEQLKADQKQLRVNQEQLRNFQTFIMKISRQIEQVKPGYRKNQEPLLKQASGANQP